MKNSRLYFEHMLSAIQDIESFTGGIAFADFEKDRKTQNAVVRALEIIGEASNRVPKEIQNKFPEMPWKEMLGTRNIIAHDYLYVDLKVVWGVVHNDLPKLKKQLQSALEGPNLS